MPKSIEIDIPGICSILHTCNGSCVNPKRCCSCYEVTINGKELQNIVDYIPMATRLCPSLKSEDGYDNVFDQICGDLYCLDTHEDGTCVLAYRKGKKVLCSLHTVAVDKKITLNKVKPMSCLLWPLVISEGKRSVLSIQDDAFEFNCNKRNTGDEFSLCPSIAENIEWAFGSRVRKKIQTAVDERLKRVSIALG